MCVSSVVFETPYRVCCCFQGDDAVHDAVRIRQLETGVPRRVAGALRNHGTGNDDVLWAALFTLAVLVRDDSVVFARAASVLVAAGVFKVRLAMEAMGPVITMQSVQLVVQLRWVHALATPLASVACSLAGYGSPA